MNITSKILILQYYYNFSNQIVYFETTEDCKFFNIRLNIIDVTRRITKFVIHFLMRNDDVITE